MVKKLLIFGFLTTTYTLLSAQSMLTGKVTDAVNHEPIPFVNVILSENGRQKWGVQSDFEGQYRFAATKAGIYDIEFSLISYENIRHSKVHLIDNQFIKLDVELKDDSFALKYPILMGRIPIVKNFNTSLIMGRVTMYGEPLPYIHVALFQGSTEMTRVTTDADGLYRIIDLNAGNYDIEFSQIGFQKTRISNIQIIDNQCFTAHAEIKEDTSFSIDLGRETLLKVKKLDSLQRLKLLDMPKSVILGCGVTSGGHSPLFYISSCQMQVNPADTMVYAVTPMPIQSLQITNAQGQEMFFRTHLHTGTQKINVHNWAKGDYNALFKEGEFVFKTTFSIMR